MENHFYCGHCYQCTHGIATVIIISLHLNSTHGLFFSDLKHICQNLNQFGYGKGTKHGGLSEYTVIPAKYAYLLKTDLDDSRAAILERELTM